MKMPPFFGAWYPDRGRNRHGEEQAGLKLKDDTDSDPASEEDHGRIRQKLLPELYPGPGCYCTPARLTSVTITMFGVAGLIISLDMRLTMRPFSIP